ncbi:ABC transporter substrate-binding protein [Brevibacterium album]|uniref:ABC transporter substrate-binding protein n=1 Tax=Brevibacterium album TaxID=417948 RepID=UPI0004032036|nr:ABC transporter substrate-binding protein [Brevibacterium album]
MTTTPTAAPPRRSLPGRRRAAGIAAAPVALALLASGCTTGGGGSGAGGDGEYSTDTIRTAMIADPNSFSPLNASGVSAYNVSSMLYGTLLYQDEDNTTTGGLASEYELDPNGGTLTIREGATCADGTEITPTVVADSLQAFVENSRQKEIVFGPGAPSFTPDDAAGTLSIELEQPWADMERGLTLSETGIVCPAGLEDLEATAAGEVEGAFSGAYTLANNQPGVSIDFELREEGFTFPEYSTPAEGAPAKNVNFAIIADYNAMANGLLTDTLDYATLVGESMHRVAGEEGFETSIYPATAMFVMFNEREGMPLADPEKRRAVAQAISREAFNDAATDGDGEVLSSYVPTEVACAYTGDLPIQQDAEAAAEVLEGESLKMIGTQATGPNGAGNSYISQALGEAGAEVDLRNVDNTTWATELDSKPEGWDLTIMNLLNLSRTQYGGLSQFTGSAPEDGGRNSTGAQRAEVIEKVNEAMAEPDEAARCAIYEEIQTGLLEDAAIVPLSTLPAQPTTAEGFSIRQFNGTVSLMSMRITA